MATVKRFEDLEVWQKARLLAKEVYKITCEGKFARDYKLRDQINSAAGSAMDNIAEGFERGGRAEFINFLTFSKGSAGEVKSQLYRALDRGYINQTKFDELYALADEVCRKDSRLIDYLNKSEFKGTKFKERKELN